MGMEARKSSVAVGRLLRRRRSELRLSLKQVSDHVALSGDRIPVSTLARIERGELDPGIVRLNKLLRLYRIRPHLVSDLMDLEELAVEAPVGKDIKTLYADGVKHWEQGNTAQGLAHLFAVRELVPDDPESKVLRQKATLAFAVFARNLGKFELAHQMVEDLLREPPDSSVLLSVLVLGAAVWYGLGSLEMAFALLARAELHVDPKEQRQVAWTFHEKGRLLALAGEPEQAEEALTRAIEAYQAVADPYGESKALLARVGALVAAHRFPEALEVAREVLARSERLGHPQLALSARTLIGRSLVASGRVADGLETLSEALAQAMSRKDRHGQFLAHYWLWKAFGAAREMDRAELELESARYFVRFVDEVSPEADEVRKLKVRGIDDTERFARRVAGPYG
jgi:tetratricopeptide (TPR) repeat protein